MLNPYLSFDGQTKAAFEFYQSVFGGEFVSNQTFADAPAEMNIPAEFHDRVMHVSLPVGDSVLMGSDHVPMFGELKTGNNISISIAPKDRAEADRIFPLLAEGGEIGMPMAETFWGAYFGTARDKFGINWMINVDLSQAGE
ncbi:VOC family protein [Acanthopleuribacter pedis]|uniref:VOC family protein n=1 Tax=Acanthopleuribacter pedis TaxID=442870 RepID=A0A8J7QIS1_9BACT|nr:VOC family protein [Acanthopleuribacter pedis]MBO1323145.1 VOC family protein [Acanthopleuribacter pedis]